MVVEFGLDFPDGMAVDWVAGNVYWTDMSFNRIEVARTDGRARRVLIWSDLTRPSSLAVNPSDGLMYWSSWGPVPLIEQANMDGMERQIFLSAKVGHMVTLMVTLLVTRGVRNPGVGQCLGLCSADL